MKQVHNNTEWENAQYMIQDHDHQAEHRFSGRFMIQDNDHMSGIPEVSQQAGQDQGESQQQGGEKQTRRKGREFL